MITDNNLLTLILSDHMDERESGMFHSTGRWRELPGEIWFQGMKNPEIELGMFQGSRGIMEVSVRDSPCAPTPIDQLSGLEIADCNFVTSDQTLGFLSKKQSKWTRTLL